MIIDEQHPQPYKDHLGRFGARFLVVAVSVTGIDHV